MRRPILPLVLVVLSALAGGCSGSSAPAPPPPSPTTRTLVLLHTTDEHSHLLGFGPESDDYPAPTVAGTGAIRGGIGRRSVLLASERQSAAAGGAATLTLSAGDNVMGTLAEATTTSIAPDWLAMGALGYDATTFGNHAFDYGPGALATAIGAAQAGGGMPPTVMTNIHFSDSDPTDDTLAALYDAAGSGSPATPVHRSLVLVASNGLRVGLVGVMGASAATDAKGSGPVSFSVPPGGGDAGRDAVMAQIYADLQPVVDHLRNDEHVDLVVALSHAGLDATTGTVSGEDTLIAQNVVGIDAIVSGHTHQVVPFLRITNAATGKDVYLQQAGQYGEYLGRLVLSVGGDGAVSADEQASAVLPIDDRIVPDPALSPLVDRVVRSLETGAGTPGRSFLEESLTRALGREVDDDPNVLGDLYFMPLASSAFDVPGLGLRKETPLMVLSSDAILAAADAEAGHSDVAVQAAGLVFGDLMRDRSGRIPYSEIVRALPLGASSRDGSLGFPLCRFAIFLVELKAALEVSAGYAYTSADAADYFLVPAGVRYEYDTSRPPFDPSKPAWDPANGRVTKITLAADHARPDDFGTVLFDLSQGGFRQPITSPVVVAANLYVAEFASSFGVTLRKPDGSGDAFASPADAILRRDDGTEVKDWDALAGFVHSQAEANGGALPSRYDGSVPGNFPRRAICAGPLCAPSPPTAAAARGAVAAR